MDFNFAHRRKFRFEHEIRFCPEILFLPDIWFDPERLEIKELHRYHTVYDPYFIRISISF